MADTRVLWRLKEADRFRFVCSVIVDQEIARAPEPVRALLRASVAPADMLSAPAASSYCLSNWRRRTSRAL
jgi:hypothetical protein